MASMACYSCGGAGAAAVTSAVLGSTWATQSALVQPPYLGAPYAPPVQVQAFDPAFYTPEPLVRVVPYVPSTISVATPLFRAGPAAAPAGWGAPAYAPTTAGSSSAPAVLPRAPPGMQVGACGTVCQGGSFSALAPTAFAANADLIYRFNVGNAAALGLPTW